MDKAMKNHSVKRFLSLLTAALILSAGFSGAGCAKADPTPAAGSPSETSEPAPADEPNEDPSANALPETEPQEEPAKEPEPAEEPVSEPETKPEDVSPYYSHVAVIGVDGGGAFFKQADTPNLDRIFENGAVNYRTHTSEPTISAQCWGSLLIGVTPDIHRLSNSYIDANPYPTDSPFPTVFRVIREAMPDAVLGSFCNWNPINHGIIEDGIDVTKKTQNSDARLTDMICNYVKESAPTLLFVQFDEADGAGHSKGFGGPEHLAQLHTEDGYIARIYQTYEDAGLADDTLFIVTADHGGNGTSHGGLSDAEKYIMWAAAGKTVIPGGAITDMEIRDTASVILYALGLADRQPDTWTARVPSDLFEGVTAKARPVYEMTYQYGHRTHESSPTPDKDAGAVSVFGTKRVLAYLPFDGDPDPAVTDYGVTAKTNGKLYYTDGFFGSCARFDDGSVTLDGWKPGLDSFSVCLWLKTGGVGSDPSIFSNKDWNSGANKGFVLSLRDSDIKFNLGNGSNRMDSEFLLPMDYKDGWVYVVLSVDREAEQIRFSYDFGPLQTADIPAALKGVSFDGLPKLNIGQDGTGRYSAHLGAEIDEFLLLSGAVSDADLEALKEVYGD
ncbi:MAG: hypothetical protein E7576_05300 [Ruminococcaceae bacterium]|nr:hypothetical protein [Oscillospiraceae bacterium]